LTVSYRRELLPPAPVLHRRVAGLTVSGAGFTALIVCIPVLARERYEAG